jgi:hypothetical protein
MVLLSTDNVDVQWISLPQDSDQEQVRRHGNKPSGSM